MQNVFSGTQMVKTIWSSWGKPQHSSQILDVTTWPNTDGSGHTGNIAHSITHLALTWPYMWVYILRILRVASRGGEAPRPGKYWRGVVMHMYNIFSSSFISWTTYCCFRWNNISKPLLLSFQIKTLKLLNDRNSKMLQMFIVINLNSFFFCKACKQGYIIWLDTS